MFVPDTNPASACVCCGGAFIAHDRAVCTSCGQPFHLAMRVDVEVPRECGEVWINEAFEALEFGCNQCLEAAGRRRPPAPNPRYRRVSSAKPAALRAMRGPLKRVKRNGDAI